MSYDKIHKLIIIGSGPAGLTAGIYAARAHLEPLIIDGKKPGGQLMGTTLVENWPGEKSIMGPDLMERMRDQAQVLGCSFSSGEIVKVDFSKRPFTLWTHRNVQLQANAVIIATGAIPRRLGCPGEDTYWGKGVSTCAVCDGAFFKGKRVAIVGGGDTAMEDASFMTKFSSDVTIVQNLGELTASHAMQQRVLNSSSISIVYNSTIKAIEGNGSQVTGAVIINKSGGQENTLAVDAVFLAIGLTPSVEPFKGQLELTPQGYLAVKNHTRSSVEGVFIAGDVADFRYRQAVTSAGSGCMAALDAERFLAGHS